MPLPDPQLRPDRPQDDAVTTTRRGDYQPQPPEAQSAFSRLVVRIEIGAAVLLVAGLSIYEIRKQKRAERQPIKIAHVASNIPMIAAHGAIGATGADGIAAGVSEGADPGKGQVLFMQTCTSCHGQKGQGMPHQGVALRGSKFITGRSDRQLVAFLKQGRKPTDPKNSTGLLMPPRGGNLSLDDDALADIVAFLRQVQKEEQQASSGEEGGGSNSDRQPTATISEPSAAKPQAPSTRPIASVDGN